MIVDIRPVSNQKDIEAWIDVPYRTLREDPAFIPPLRFEERRRISPKSPFFRFADVRLFVAYDDAGLPVGRISAQINRRYLDRYNNSIGHFGFFDTVDDQTVSSALITAAGDWLKMNGMRRMEGPFNLSVNEACGLLVKGFDTAPAMMMPHSGPSQPEQLEKAGLRKVIDLYSYRLWTFTPPEKIAWLADNALSDPKITVRPFDKKRLHEELALMVDIFNDAWADNWGFVPLTVSEIEYMMQGLMPFMRGHYGKFVSVSGEPVGFVLVLPNINSIIAKFNGRLLPTNWLRLAYSLITERFDSGRMPLLGMRKAYQGSIDGARLFAALIQYHLKDLHPYEDRYTKRGGDTKGGWIELSWVLETNRPLVNFLKSIFGDPHKTYRIYGKDL